MIFLWLLLWLPVKTKTCKSLHFQRFRAGDERIELPPKVLETPIIPFDQSPTKYIIHTFKTTYMLTFPWELTSCVPIEFCTPAGHLATPLLSVICFANVQSVSGMLLHKQACSESFLLHPAASSASWSSPHPISNSQLHALLHFHLCPIYLVVFKGVYFFRMGYLILRGASRLDAFSVYPFRAWLLGRRLGSLTDAPAARPSRSSRTKDSSSQISYAHAG